MLRRTFLLLLLAVLGGCAKPDLADTIVTAATPGELASFRASVGAQFSGEQLQAFDTALQELKLDAMHREIATAAAREQDACAAVNGKTVRQAEILGWQARRARLEREIAFVSGVLERDLKQPNANTALIQNQQDVLARLRSQLAEAEQRLASWVARKVG